jgi:hypothetical protein
LFVVVGVRGLIIYLFVWLFFCHLMNCFVWIGFWLVFIIIDFWCCLFISCLLLVFYYYAIF